MSDPVTNVEIEDVLSSIRRLVSEDSRAPQPQAETRPAAPERLVLTPALRVPDAAAEPKQPAATPATPVHPALSEEPGPDEMRLTRRLRPSEEETSTPAWRRASFETVRTEERQEPEEAHLDDAPETAELPSSLLAPGALSEPPLAAEPAPEEMAESEEAPFIEVAEEDEPEDQGASIADFFAAKLRDTPRATPPEPVAEITPKEGSLARKIAELEEMIARSTTEFEPETGEAAPEAIFRHQPVISPESAPVAEAPQAPQAELDEDDAELASRPMPEPELVDRPFETDVTGEPDLDEEEDAPFAFRRSSSERAPQLEIAEPDAESAAEPELASDVPEMPKPSARRPVKILRNPVWQRSQSNLRREAEELAAAPSAEAPAPEPEEAAAPAQVEAEVAEVASAPEPIQEPVTEARKVEEGADLLAALDQETLRKLVAEVVREELQGAIGERVSRNLRKLVRNEIQRIAMSADLD
ncbi:hypothetical protein AYJ57_03700 [Salipiger sp. CCB-MM3]|uniref:hypothetical protein n=1 Tax=Salipiger sp. CCB-MM3 TaxID=1792508 RepID=UPI00080AA7CE|nr:hypothetical protein [Salipiger sp. CCB-MM3]ANT59547.1 hypothetical protein AYJ57_03700 [Salipiger sp. CCB-MM3]